MKSKYVLYCLICICYFLPTRITAQKLISIQAFPKEAVPGTIISITKNSGCFLADFKNFDFKSKYSIKFDNQTLDIITATHCLITCKVPENTKPGEHIISFRINDGDSGSTKIIVKENTDSDSYADGNEPDPKKQYGDSVEAGKNPKGKERGSEVNNPSGGYGNEPKIECSLLHKIDGKFTDSVSGDRKEWSGIMPLNGRFSELYMDYCDEKGILYLLNDWYLATENPDTTCYNLFTFYTANGDETWNIRVYHSTYKGTIVFRNNVNVTKDTNYVIGGKAGFHSSPLHKLPHTIYEFGIKVKPGRFFFPELCDPVRPNGVSTVCNDTSTYGLIGDPSYFHGDLYKGGMVLKEDGRYIPRAGVAGLATEPNTFGGTLGAQSTFRMIGSPSETISCIAAPHTIDGSFTDYPKPEHEWSKSKPAIGRWSNLYADYCNGTLYILNDWILGIEEPDMQNCYNLFELFTGNGKQHWGIYVYHSVKKGIKVFLNGKDVSGDTLLVKGGKFGFGKSPLMSDKVHTIYEFGIKADEGPWNLMMCDPGPSSFCDNSDESIPRRSSGSLGFRRSISPFTQDSLQVHLFDTSRIVLTSTSNPQDIGGSKFHATIQYDPAYFRPLQVSKSDESNGKNISPNLVITDWTIVSPGTLSINGECINGYMNAGDFCMIDGIFLFGRRGETSISGSIEFGNNARMMRYTSIKPIRVVFKQPIMYGDLDKDITATLTTANNYTTDIIHLALTVHKSQRITCKIYDETGRTIMSKGPIDYLMGEHTIEFKTGDHQKGAFYLMIITENGTLTIPYINKE